MRGLLLYRSQPLRAAPASLTVRRALGNPGTQPAHPEGGTAVLAVTMDGHSA